ncbi:hypothetical protein K432DRAFT_347720 [Lepidopterella palustris CBS 459.81]|uniref:DUF4048 domain-containing protein n=1 Tax=Lepidopterella palustris CBS 459.81 TaxID=1314670 RepID=A0A8E2EFI8_9PEZI|nr:hypothetical protein K432DRAFT_347720 [Lepidopterella palustris CBS 459.81]
MGLCSAGPNLLKSWISWLKGGLVLRVFGIPIALFAWHLEIYGYSRTSLLLHRLSRRIALPTLYLFFKGHDMNNFFFVGGADVMDHDSSKTMAARKRSTTPDEVERILSSGGPTSPMAPPPAEHIGTPSSPSTTNALSLPSPNRSTFESRSSMSHTDVVKQGKRLSLHFPIQPAAGSTSPRISPRSRPQSWIVTPISSPEIVPSPTEGNFLTVLATQERRVLELKEELAKAEQDLVKLKKHWATHESMKKNNDIRRVQQLQPLNTGFANITGDDDDTDGSSAWMQKEMERRKALLSGTRTSQRKVFSGSRHTRTLSLLSPDKGTFSPSFPQPADIRQSLEEEPNKRMPLSRSSTTPDMSTQVVNTVKDDKYDLGGIQRDALLRTGKQMANDFKDGLLTFIEDLRQATVGEEAINGEQSSQGLNGQQAAKRQPSRGSLKSRPFLNRSASSAKKSAADNGDLIDIGGSFWKEHGLNEPKSSNATKVTKGTKGTKGGKTPQKTPQKPSDDFEDSWDTWDTPNDKYMPAESSNDSDTDGPTSQPSALSSPRTSTSSNGLATPARTTSNRDSIPWPALSKISPTQLKRTASHLMKEWEKSLTPPPESRESSHSSGDYIGRSASPARKG